MLHQVLVSTTHGKKIKKSYKRNKFRISAPAWNEKLNLLGRILYLMLKIILNISSNIPSIRININKIENVITFKIKAGYLELLKHKTTKLLGRTEKK